MARRLALLSAALVALVVAVATVAAMLDGQRPVLIETASEPRDVRLVADVEKPRYLATRRMLEVILLNEGRSPLQIERLQLRAQHFTRRPPTVRDARLQPGVRVDMPISYGRVRCAPAPTPAGAEPSVVVHVRGADGHLRAVPLAVPTPNEVLDRLRDDECETREIRRAVDVGFGSSWAPTATADDAAVRGSLLLRRRATSRPVTLLEVAGTVIFDLRTVPRRSVPFARMAPGVRSVDIPIEISAARCDAHALTESKKTFRFPLWVNLGDDPEHYLEIEPHGHGRRLLDELLKACAPGADD